MIEELFARSGDRIFKNQGRLLCSSVDPRSEARKWAASLTEGERQSRRLVILGLGCGYHVIELKKQLPSQRLLVISDDEDVTRTMQTIHALELGNTEILTVKPNEDPLENARLRNWLQQPYQVVNHLPSQQFNQEFFSDIEHLFIARDAIFFSQIVRRDLRLSQLFPLTSIPGGTGGDLLTIKSLDHLVDGKGLSRQDALLIRTLREMVK